MNYTLKLIIITIIIILLFFLSALTTKGYWGRLTKTDEFVQVDDNVKMFIVYDQLEKVNCYVVVGHQATSEIMWTGKNVAVDCIKTQ